jgi:hypothetical protein
MNIQLTEFSQILNLNLNSNTNKGDKVSKDYASIYDYDSHYSRSHAINVCFHDGL